MDEYIDKLEQLPTDRLKTLIDIYRRSIKQLQETYDQAVMAAMNPVIEYVGSELKKKRADLAAIERLLAARE